MAEKANLSIIILTAAPESKATKSIVKAGEARGHVMHTFNPAELNLLISNNVKGYDRIYHAAPDYHRPERINVRECDAVISRIGADLPYGSAVLEHFNKNLDVFCTQSADGIKTAANKLISLQRLSQKGVKVPKTVIGNNIIHAKWLIEQVGGLPAIAKTLQGSQGVGVFPLMDQIQTNAMLESFYKSKTNLIIQEMIDAGRKDIRAIVIDGKVVVAMERMAKEDELRSNISLGGSGKRVFLSPEDEQICIDAAAAVGLSGAAGVDLMKDTNGVSYVIEVNSNYGYKVEEITNTDISTPLIEYCERNHRKGSIATPTTQAASDKQSAYWVLASLYAGIQVALKSPKVVETTLRKIRFELNELHLTEYDLQDEVKKIFYNLM